MLIVRPDSPCYVLDPDESACLNLNVGISEL